MSCTELSQKCLGMVLQMSRWQVCVSMTFTGSPTAFQGWDHGGDGFVVEDHDVGVPRRDRLAPATSRAKGMAGLSSWVSFPSPLRPVRSRLGAPPPWILRAAGSSRAAVDAEIAMPWTALPI